MRRGLRLAAALILAARLLPGCSASKGSGRPDANPAGRGTESAAANAVKTAGDHGTTAVEAQSADAAARAGAPRAASRTQHDGKDSAGIAQAAGSNDDSSTSSDAATSADADSPQSDPPSDG